jgi:hypothetical protein
VGRRALPLAWRRSFRLRPADGAALLARSHPERRAQRCGGVAWPAQPRARGSAAQPAHPGPAQVHGRALSGEQLDRHVHAGRRGRGACRVGAGARCGRNEAGALHPRRRVHDGQPEEPPAADDKILGDHRRGGACDRLSADAGPSADRGHRGLPHGLPLAAGEWSRRAFTGSQGLGGRRLCGRQHHAVADRLGARQGLRARRRVALS